MTFDDLLPIYPRPRSTGALAVRKVHMSDKLGSLLEWGLVEAVELYAAGRALRMPFLTVLSHVPDKLCLGP